MAAVRLSAHAWNRPSRVWPPLGTPPGGCSYVASPLQRQLLHPPLFRDPFGLLLSRPHPRRQASAGKGHKPPPTLLHPVGSRHPADIWGPLSPLAVSCLSSVPTTLDRCPTQLSYRDALGMTVLTAPSPHTIPTLRIPYSETPKSEVILAVLV